MVLTLEEQRDTLLRAARDMGIEIERDEIEWRDGRLNVDGLTLHYLDWGATGAHPMLLLHGGLQQAHSWDLVAVALKRRYHIVALDMRGHGDSDWSDDGEYGYATHASDVRRLLDHLGWERLVLVGLSLGGLTSMELAASGGAQLDALAIVDVGPELNPGGVGKIVEFGRESGGLKSIDEYIEKAMAYNPRRSPELLRYSLTHSLRQEPDGSWSWKYDRRVAGRRRETGDAEPQQTPGYFSEMWERLRGIACPALVVRGAESEVFMEKTGRRMAEAMPDCRFVTVEGAGHTVPQDNPAGFLDALNAFLKGQGLP